MVRTLPPPSPPSQSEIPFIAGAFVISGKSRFRLPFLSSLQFPAPTPKMIRLRASRLWRRGDGVFCDLEKKLRGTKAGRMLKVMKTTLCLLGVLGAIWVAGPSAWAETSEDLAISPEEMVGHTGLAEGFSLLAKCGNPLLPAAIIEDAVFEALLRTADSGVEFLPAEEASSPAGTDNTCWESGLFWGISAGLPRVAAVWADSPGATAGIQAGDYLVKIGELDVEEGCPLKDIRAALRSGTEASLRLALTSEIGNEDKRRDVVLERIPCPEKSLAAVEILPAGIGYLCISAVQAGTAEEVSTVLKTWMATSGVTGVIMDLRGAGGGDAAPVAALSAAFVPPGKVLYRVREGGGEERTVAAATTDLPRCTWPLMILIDEETSGAAELLAASLSGNEGVMLIGRPSVGDPLVRDVLTRVDGRRVRLAVRTVTTDDGAIFDGQTPLMPDVLITDRALDESVYEPEEPVLRKGKTLSDEEKEDRALRDRTRFDTYLRRATDVLLGLRALGYDRVP